MPIRGRWLALGVLSAGRMMIAYQFQDVGAVSQPLMAGLGLTYSDLGFLVGLYMLPGIVISISSGAVATRVRDKTIFLICLAMMVAGGVLAGVASPYSLVCAGRLVAGLGAVLLNVTLSKAVGDWFGGRELLVAMALFVASWPLGIGLSLIVEPIVATRLSWSAALIVSAALTSMTLVMTALLYRLVKAIAGPTPSLLTTTWQELTCVSIVGAIWALFNVSYIVLMNFAPTLLTAHGLSGPEAGHITSLATWVLAVSTPLGGAFIARTAWPNLAMGVSFVMMAVSIMLVALLDNPLWGLAGFGIVCGIPAGPLLALATLSLQPRNRSPGMGLFYFWYYLGVALLPPLTGYLRDLSGDPRTPMWFAAAMCLLCIGLVGIFAIARRALQPAATAQTTA